MTDEMEPEQYTENILTYDALHKRTVEIISQIKRSRNSVGIRRQEHLINAQQQNRELLFLLRQQNGFSASPSSCVAEAQALMHHAVICSELHDNIPLLTSSSNVSSNVSSSSSSSFYALSEAQAYHNASAMWFRIENERRRLNFPTCDDALANGVLCGAMAAAALLRDVPDLRDSPLPQHASILCSTVNNSNNNNNNNNKDKNIGGSPNCSSVFISDDVPKMPNMHLSRAWAELMRVGTTLEDFQCLEMAANYYELAAVILLQEKTHGLNKPSSNTTIIENDPNNNNNNNNSSSTTTARRRSSFMASFTEQHSTVAAAAKNITKGIWGRVGEAFHQLKDAGKHTQSSLSSTSSSTVLPQSQQSSQTKRETVDPSSTPLREDTQTKRSTTNTTTANTNIPECDLKTLLETTLKEEFPLQVYPRTLMYEFSLALYNAACVSAYTHDYARALLYIDTLLQILTEEAQRRRPCSDPPLFPQSLLHYSKLNSNWDDWIGKSREEEREINTGESCNEKDGCVSSDNNMEKSHPNFYNTTNNNNNEKNENNNNSTLFSTLAFIPPTPTPTTTMDGFAFIFTHLTRWVQLIVLKVYILLILSLQQQGEGEKEKEKRENKSEKKEGEREEEKEEKLKHKKKKSDETTFRMISDNDLLMQVSVLFDLAGELRRVGREIIHFPPIYMDNININGKEEEEKEEKEKERERERRRGIQLMPSYYTVPYRFNTAKEKLDTVITKKEEKEVLTDGSGMTDTTEIPPSENRKTAQAKRMAQRLLQSDALREIRARAAKRKTTRIEITTTTELIDSVPLDNITSNDTLHTPNVESPGPHTTPSVPTSSSEQKQQEEKEENEKEKKEEKKEEKEKEEKEPEMPHKTTASSDRNKCERSEAYDDMHIREIAASLWVVCVRVREYNNSITNAPAARSVLRSVIAMVDDHLLSAGMFSRTLTVMGQRVLREVFYPITTEMPEPSEVDC